MSRESLDAGRHGSVARSDQSSFCRHQASYRPTPAGAVNETGPSGRCPKGLRSFVPPAHIACSEGN
jgi:hypothetical protein